MTGIRDPVQRVAVAGVMEDLSGFQVLLGRVTIGELEIDAMLDVLLGTETAGRGLPCWPIPSDRPSGCAAG
jgi:hypothetical protein